MPKTTRPPARTLRSRCLSLANPFCSSPPRAGQVLSHDASSCMKSHPPPSHGNPGIYCMYEAEVGDVLEKMVNGEPACSPHF